MQQQTNPKYLLGKRVRPLSLARINWTENKFTELLTKLLLAAHRKALQAKLEKHPGLRTRRITIRAKGPTFGGLAQRIKIYPNLGYVSLLLP